MENNSAQYGGVYSDIVRGYTEKIVLNKKYYFKHPTQSEHFEILGRYNLILNDAIKRGLETEEVKVSEAIKNGWWSPQKENRYLQLKDTIKNLNKTKNSLVLPSQKDQLQEQIDRNNFVLITFLKERNEIVGYTAERYANERLYDETLLLLTFKNTDLTERVFSNPDDYYYLSDDHVEKIRAAFHSYSDLFGSNVIKYIAASVFFQNMLYVTSECDALHFWGLASSKCTKYQLDLLIHGKMFKNAVKHEGEEGRSLPDDILYDPVKFVEWHDAKVANTDSSSNYSSSSTNSSSSNTVSSFVGATKEDLKKLGIKVQPVKGGKSLLQLARENGGMLQKDQYLNAREGA